MKHYHLNPTIQSSLQALQGDPNAQQVVDLVQRAGRASNDHYLHLAGDYLPTRQSAQTFWQALPVKSGVPLSLDLPPVPSHLADYEATANRLLDRLVTAESNSRHYGNDGSLLESPRGAQGITQVMPATGKDPIAFLADLVISGCGGWWLVTSGQKGSSQATSHQPPATSH